MAILYSSIQLVFAILVYISWFWQKNLLLYINNILFSCLFLFLFYRQLKLQRMWSLVTKNWTKLSSVIAAAGPFLCFSFFYWPSLSSFLIGIVKLDKYIFTSCIFDIVTKKKEQKNSKIFVTEYHTFCINFKRMELVTLFYWDQIFFS